MSTIGERYYSKKHYAPGNIVDGKRVKVLREIKGWSVDELARRTDLTPENLDRLERGDGNTSTGKVGALARELEVHPAALISGVEEFIQQQEPAATRDRQNLAFHPDRDVTLIRTFAGDGEAYLQIGALKTEIPDAILGDVLHMIAVHKLRSKV